jgi:hypothetical protein
MPTTKARSAQVLTAELAGNGTSQDRLILLGNAVLVLDGASSAEDKQHDGGWYAEQLGAAMAGALRSRPERDLQHLLAESIRAIRDQHKLMPGASPSSTVAIARWDAEHLDALVLGDSSIVAIRRSTETELIDSRLAAIAKRQRAAYRDRLRRGGTYDSEHRRLMRSLYDEESRWRNHPDGYWIADTQPDAAAHALTARWPIDELRAVILATDGTRRGLDPFGLYPDWSALLDATLHDGPAAVLNTIHEAETQDPHGQRWPRGKRHDDKTLAVCLLPT